MFGHVERWLSQSNITQSTFAKEVGLTKNVFSYWVRKYKATKGEGSSSSSFVEISPSQESQAVVKEQSQEKSIRMSKTAIEISLPGGICIKVNI